MFQSGDYSIDKNALLTPINEFFIPGIGFFDRDIFMDYDLLLSILTTIPGQRLYPA
jgi:hypothetical protein